MKQILLLILIITAATVRSQSLEAFEVTDKWEKKIEKLAPKKPQEKPARDRKVLVLSLHTGFQHWVIPHTSSVVRILGEKSGAYSVLDTKDISYFEDPAKLAEFDAIVLNNTCSDGKRRDLFWDELGKDTSIDEETRMSRAATMERNLIQYVENGGGLVAMHGAIVTQNKSEAFGEMMGGSFEYHPIQQKIDATVVDDKHPITASFSSGVFSHYDEPYFFNNAYFDYNFRPLLFMDVNKLVKLREEVSDMTKYISWIKRHGEGRVFYTSPSHNAQSMESEELLAFFLNGIQYALGDLKCDDSPLGN